MSSYVKNIVIRCPFSSGFGVNDIWDMENKYPDLFGNDDANKFTIGVTDEANFIDYVLSSNYNADYGVYGHSRYLGITEAECFLPIFRQLNPDIQPSDLRYVEYCYYNCSEPPCYYYVDGECPFDYLDNEFSIEYLSKNKEKLIQVLDNMRECAILDMKSEPKDSFKYNQFKTNAMALTYALSCIGIN